MIKIISIYSGLLLVHVFAQERETAGSADICDTLAHSEYRITVGDVLEIVVLGQEELTRNLMVMHDGNISFPLIGDVYVKNLTTDEITQLISEKLKKYFVQPVVSVILKGPTFTNISVFGEVVRPGTVDYQRGLRVTDYLALAGGPTRNAELRRIRVVRSTVDNPVVLNVDVNAILKKGRDDQNIELRAGDWIYVDKKFAIDWSIVLQLTTLVLTATNLYIAVQHGH